jgi:MSHA biogenesis protein MshM
MYRQHFGIIACPLDKGGKTLFTHTQLEQLASRFQWLLDSPGIGVLTGDAGVGKTAALRHLTADLNPHSYKVIYSADTDCSPRDFYRNLAVALGLDPAYRRTQLWSDIKDCITDLVDNKRIQPVWIIDEAQNLPAQFFRDFPAFLNYAFDARDMITVWFVGMPQLNYALSRASNAALTSRIHTRLRLDPVQSFDQFKALIDHGFKSVGCTQTLLSDSGYELLRQASQGMPRQAGQLLKTAMRLAVPKELNHLPDDLVLEAIEGLL